MDRFSFTSFGMTKFTTVGGTFGGPTNLRWRAHEREKESLSSVSTHAIAINKTTRYSQCSNSMTASFFKLGEDLGGDDPEVHGGIREGQQLHGGGDERGELQALIVHDNGATPNSPNSAFKHKHPTGSRELVPGSESLLQQEEEPNEEFDEVTSSLDLTPSGGASGNRRTSFRCIEPLGYWHRAWLDDKRHCKFGGEFESAVPAP